MEARLRAFLNFLEERRVKKGELFTHVAKESPLDGCYPGRFYIELDDREDFIKLYQELVKNRIPLTIAEKPEQYGPLRVDADFKTSLEGGIQRQYTKDTLAHLVKIYQEEIHRIIDPEAFDPKMLWCMVLEKENPRKEEEVVKDGFHIHFPHFICDAWTQDVFLRKKVTERMTSEGVWAGCNFITRLNKIIDTGMARKPWMMYGSMNYKGEKSTPYIYSAKKEIGIIFDNNQRETTLSKLFEDEMIGRRGRAQYFLPEFLSIRGNPQTPLLNTAVKGFQEHSRKKKANIVRTKTESEILQDLKTIEKKEIMDMLSPERADDYSQWIRVGWALFNISQGHEKALKMWIEFSTLSDKFVEGVCEEEWSKMSLGSIGMGTLMWWAKHDSPEEYRNNSDYQLNQLLWNCLYTSKPTEFRLAELLNHKYKDRFKCAIIGKHEFWYEFPENGHKWMEIPGEISLRLLLPQEIIPDFLDVMNQIDKRYGEEEASMGDSSRTKLFKKRCRTLMEALETAVFQNKVINQFKLFVADYDFLEKLDMNRNLLGCENGVLDLEQGIFRHGEPDDFVSLSTGITYRDYNINNSIDNDIIDELDSYLTKTFPNPHLRDYFIDIMASCLPGNLPKVFLVMTGNGDNGKSVTVGFLEMVFGGYCGKFPRELLIRGKGNSSGSARPELSRVKGKRIMFCQEIGNDVDELNVGVLKELTGNDSFFARGLFKEGAEIKPFFTLMLQCNDPPKIPGDDDPTWNRVRVLDYESKFVKPQDLDKDEEHTVADTFAEQVREKKFMADPCFSDKLHEIAPALLWRIFKKYVTLYKVQERKGPYEPQEVTLSTKNYRTKNDVFSQFIDENVEKIEDPEELKKSIIGGATMFKKFTGWYKANFPYRRREVMDRDTMEKGLAKRLGSGKYGLIGQKWYGYKFIMPQEEDSSGFEERGSSLAERRKQLEKDLS